MAWESARLIRITCVAAAGCAGCSASGGCGAGCRAEIGVGEGFSVLSISVIGYSGLKKVFIDHSRRQCLAVGEMVPKEVTEVMQGVVVLAVAATTAWMRGRGRVERQT